MTQQGVRCVDLCQVAADELAKVQGVRRARLWATHNDDDVLTVASPKIAIQESADSPDLSLTRDSFKATSTSDLWISATTLRISEPASRTIHGNTNDAVWLSLDFVQPPETDVASVVQELCDSLLKIVTQTYVSEELERISGQLCFQTEQTSGLDQLYAKLYSGTTLNESFASIASVVAERCGAERVSLFRFQGGRFRLIATSTQSNIDRRAQQVRLIEQLTTSVLSDRTEFQYNASRREDEDIDENIGLERYLLSAGSKSIEIRAVPGEDQKPIAAIVSESFREEHLRNQTNNQEIVDKAIRRSIARSEIDTWSLVTSTTSRVVSDTSLARKCLAGALVIGVLSALLTFVPASLDIPIDGRLQAVNTQRLFAPTDAVTQSVLVNHGQVVSQGDVLVQLRSLKLDLLEEQLRGDLATAQTELAVSQASRSSIGASNASAQANNSSSTQQLLDTRIRGLSKQLAIVVQQQESLTIRSPMDGQVNRWDLQNVLMFRPVVHGELLLEIVAPDDGWQAQLDIPDSEFGYVSDALGNGAVPVSFRLANDSQTRLIGNLSRVSGTASITENGDSILRGIVDLSESTDDSAFRVGATLSATAHCGKRSLGFVWFRSVIGWFRQQSWW